MPPVLKLAKALAASRIFFGAAIVAAPHVAASVWIGRRRAARTETAVLGRALGARDLVLGIVALRALAGSDRAAANAAMAGCAISDGVDLLATVAARDRLPTVPAAFTALAAGGSAAVGLAALMAAERPPVEAPVMEVRPVR